MPVLDNPRHEKFCRAVAKGMKGGEAYRHVYGKHLSNPRGQASLLLKNEDICERVKELMQDQADGDIITQRELLEYLTKAIITPIEQIDANNPLCQSMKFSQLGQELKMVSKLGAADLLAKMRGWLDGDLRNKISVGVNVNVTVMSEEKRAELIRKKQQSLERRTARMADGIPGQN